ISYMMEDPRTITPALEIVFIAKSIERIGDHAKNVAENVVHVVKGKDVRHALPDLVLLDWMQPGQSGLALARTLRADARTRELPIIMLTARGDETDRIAGLEAWVDDYVTKPFSPRELRARIKSVLRRRAPEAAQEMLAIGALQLDPAAHRVTAAGTAVDLGPTEFRLLKFL